VNDWAIVSHQLEDKKGGSCVHVFCIDSYVRKSHGIGS
jgi:hypothetical protein